MKYRRLFFIGMGFLMLGLTLGFMERRFRTTDEHTTIGFVGDVMIGRLVNEVIGEKGYRYPWGTMLHELRDIDLMIANLETTLTHSDKKVPKVFNFKAFPDRVKSLSEAGFDVVCIANNHILDYGTEGLFETIATLDRAGISHVGAGRNASEARAPVIRKIKGITIGIIGFTDNEPTWKAEENKPGTNYFHVGDREKVKNDIAQVRDKVDILIATQQWGPNKREVPTHEFIEFAHAMIDEGFDIIHGHSAHVTQGIEVYKGKLIMYDTGDFVDDYMVGPMLRNDHSFLFRLVLKGTRMVRLELVPVLISNMQVSHAPQTDSNEMVERMIRLSKQFGTKFQKQKGMLVLDLM